MDCYFSIFKMRKFVRRVKKYNPVAKIAGILSLLIQVLILEEDL